MAPMAIANIIKKMVLAKRSDGFLVLNNKNE
jgi:hypothetical protein